MKKIINIVLLMIILFFSLLIFYSIYNIINHVKDSNNINKNLEIINKNITKEEVTDTDNTTIVQNNIDEKDSYWIYLNSNLTNVSFDKLKEINNEVKGWLKVEGTSVDYPYVKTSNNTFYLSHSFDKSKNIAGWIFQDYRNDDINDKNTIIYGHDRSDRLMFGSLKDTLKKEWFDNKANHIITLSTEYVNSLWQIFSIYTIPNTNDYIKINFSSNEEFNDFLTLIKNRSIYDFETDIVETDKILTLSTCYKNADNKLVIHARLIKYENK